MARTFSAKTARPVAQAAQRLAQLAMGPDQPLLPRQGPRPLGMHLTGALSLWLGLPIVWPSLKKNWPGLSPELAPRLEKLRTQLGPGQNPEFHRALTAAAVARARLFISGIQSYRQNKARRNMLQAPVIWQAGTTRVRDYNPANPGAPSILVIPSLINRFDILDLDRNHSFLRALAERGLRPVVVDWDIPGDDEKNFSLTDYASKRLVPVLDFITNGAPLLLLGYCMGGNLALALAALRPHQIRALALLATPWDFHQPDATIGPQFLALAANLEPYLESLGYLPVDIIQSLFAGFQPGQVMSKFTDFAGLDPASLEARHFVLLEDWLNDGVPLTAPVARECLRDWYGENLPGKRTWHIEGKLVDPRILTMPAYVTVPGKDRIVPPESALPLAKLLPRASLHEPMTGHVGMIASPKAPQQVWTPLMAWLEKHK